MWVFTSSDNTTAVVCSTIREQATQLLITYHCCQYDYDKTTKFKELQTTINDYIGMTATREDNTREGDPQSSEEVNKVGLRSLKVGLHVSEKRTH